MLINPSEEKKKANDAADPRNELNDLTGKEWIKFTRTWFIANSKRYWQNKGVEFHPARYPEEMVHEFIAFFTKSGQWVLDPFLGSGATLVTCAESGRNGIGVELNPRYVKASQRRLQQLSLFGQTCKVFQGDVMEIDTPEFWDRYTLPDDLSRDERTRLPLFDFVMTSPPYWNMLRKSRGGVESAQKRRKANLLDTYYSNDPKDIGNIEEYGDFIEALGKAFDKVAKLLRLGKYLVVVVQNLRTPEGEVKPLAWDLNHRLSQTLLFQGERIWCQNTKMLGIWGYPKIFVPNYHHHYCLIYRKVQ
jgi:DNA modification methylase